jgi:hypothetical protein
MNCQNQSVPKKTTVQKSLVDSGSNKTHADIKKIPKWLIEQALPANDAPFAGWGSEFTTKKIVALPFVLTQIAPNQKISHEVHLSEVTTSGNNSYAQKMIIGQDIMRKLGLNLNFYNETPVITWNKLSVPMVKHGFWTHD